MVSNKKLVLVFLLLGNCIATSNSSEWVRVNLGNYGDITKFRGFMLVRTGAFTPKVQYYLAYPYIQTKKKYKVDVQLEEYGIGLDQSM